MSRRRKVQHRHPGRVKPPADLAWLLCDAEVDVSAMGELAGYGRCAFPRGCAVDSVMRVALTSGPVPLPLCAEHGLQLVVMAAKRGQLADVSLGSPVLEMMAAVELAAYPQWRRLDAVREFLAGGGYIDPVLLEPVGLA